MLEETIKVETITKVEEITGVDKHYGHNIQYVEVKNSKNEAIRYYYWLDISLSANNDPVELYITMMIPNNEEQINNTLSHLNGMENFVISFGESSPAFNNYLNSLTTTWKLERKDIIFERDNFTHCSLTFKGRG
jgi:hypothetical protein